MKVIWAPEDIYCGLRVGRDGDTLSKGMIVGYDPADRSKPRRNLRLISLDDGMIVTANSSHAEIADWLIRNNELPVEVLGRRKSEIKDGV